jgi:hypothetical protein
MKTLSSLKIGDSILVQGGSVKLYDILHRGAHVNPSMDIEIEDKQDLHNFIDEYQLTKTELDDLKFEHKNYMDDYKELIEDMKTLTKTLKGITPELKKVLEPFSSLVPEKRELFNKLEDTISEYEDIVSSHDVFPRK